MRQPLLPAKLYNAEFNQLEYRAMMDQEVENFKIGFQPVSPQLIDVNSCQVETGPVQPTSPEIKRTEFGPTPDTDSRGFDFKSKIVWLPFQLNIWKEANLTWEQQSCFINLI